LLTSVSMRPNRSMTASVIASTAARSVTSVAMPIESLPRAAAVSSAFAWSRSATTTVAPSAASRVAMPLPMPEAAPVTMMMRSVSAVMGSSWRGVSVLSVCAVSAPRSGRVRAAGGLPGDDELHDLGRAVADLHAQHVPHPLLHIAAGHVAVLAVEQQALVDGVVRLQRRPPLAHRGLRSVRQDLVAQPQGVEA